LGLPFGMLSSLLALLCVYGIAALVIHFQCSDKSLTFFSLMFPFIVLVFRPHEPVERLIIEGLVLIPLFIIFHKKQFRAAQLGLVFCAVITATIEIQEQQSGTMALKLLLFSFVIAGLIYELRIPSASHSSFRQFVGLAPLVLLIFMFLKTLHWSDIFQVWIWSGTVLVYQLIRIYIEKIGSPSRVAWIIWPLIYAVSISEQYFPWYMQTAIILALISLLHLVALRLNNKFLSDSAVWQLSMAAIFTFIKSEEKYSTVNIVMGLLTAWNMMLISRRQQFGPSLGWWEGFIISDHVMRLKSFLLMIIGPFLRMPFISFIFAAARSSFIWLKYFKGDKKPIVINDLLFLSAHLYGALMFTRQLSLYLQASVVTAAQHGLTVASIWIIWGLCLVIAGSRSKTIYHRLIGISFLLVPIAEEINRWNIKNTILHSGLVILTSSALWLTVLLARSHRLMDAPEIADESLRLDEAGGERS